MFGTVKDQQQLKSFFLRNGGLKGQIFDFSKLTPSIEHENQTQMISENKLQFDIQNQSKTSWDQTTLNDKEGPKI